MMGKRYVGRALCVTALLTLTAPSALHAQSQPQDKVPGNWPDHAVRIVVPYTPGGTNDILARLYGQKLSELLGQPFVVENRAGAQGIVGTEAVAHAKPDGYTLLLGASGPLIYNPATYRRLPYDPVQDLVPVCRMVVVPPVIVAGSRSPHGDVPALVAAARAKPGGLTYGTSSAAFQLPMELLNQRAGTRITFVAYRSAADAINATANGEVDIAVVDTGAIAAALQGGRIRALSVMSRQRDPNFPAVPSIAEQGFADLDATTFSALVAPAGTSPAILRRLTQACDSISSEQDMKNRMADLGMTPSPAPPEELARFIAERIPFWRGIAEAAGLQMER
jgi:tripartite-type tricarboxylate transporter receptor subunit TctC